MQVKDLKVGDNILLKYRSGDYRKKRIVKAIDDVRFYYSFSDTLEALGDRDVWLLDNEKEKSIFSDSDIKFLERFILVSLVCAGAVILGTLLSNLG